MSSCSIQNAGLAQPEQLMRQCPTCGLKVANPFITKCPRCATKLSLAELCTGCFQSSACHGSAGNTTSRPAVHLTLPHHPQHGEP